MCEFDLKTMAQRLCFIRRIAFEKHLDNKNLTCTRINSEKDTFVFKFAECRVKFRRATRDADRIEQVTERAVRGLAKDLRKSNELKVSTERFRALMQIAERAYLTRRQVQSSSVRLHLDALLQRVDRLALKARLDALSGSPSDLTVTRKDRVCWDFCYSDVHVLYDLTGHHGHYGSMTDKLTRMFAKLLLMDRDSWRKPAQTVIDAYPEFMKEQALGRGNRGMVVTTLELDEVQEFMPVSLDQAYNKSQASKEQALRRVSRGMTAAVIATDQAYEHEKEMALIVDNLRCVQIKQAIASVMDGVGIFPEGEYVVEACMDFDEYGPILTAELLLEGWLEVGIEFNRDDLAEHLDAWTPETDYGMDAISRCIGEALLEAHVDDRCETWPLAACEKLIDKFSAAWEEARTTEKLAKPKTEKRSPEEVLEEHRKAELDPTWEGRVHTGHLVRRDAMCRICEARAVGSTLTGRIICESGHSYPAGARLCSLCNGVTVKDYPDGRRCSNCGHHT